MPYVFIQQMLVEHVPACLCQGSVLHSCDGAGADPPQAFGYLSVALPSSGSVPRGREMQSSWGRFCRAVQAFQLHPLTCDPGHISNVSPAPVAHLSQEGKGHPAPQSAGGSEGALGGCHGHGCCSLDPWTRPRDVWASARFH